MEELAFQLCKPEFEHLDKFLSTVSLTSGSNYVFTIPGFSYPYPDFLLRRFGFEFVSENPDSNRVYRFDNTPDESPVLFSMPKGVEPSSKQWTVFYQDSDQCFVCWNGPTKDIGAKEEMEKLGFKLTSKEFEYLHRFLSNVEPFPYFSYRFELSDFQSCSRNQLLCALGFEHVNFIHLHKKHAVYFFKNTQRSARIFVPKDQVISTQWTKETETTLLICVYWNGPTIKI